VFVDIDSLATEAFTETNKTRRLRPVFTTWVRPWRWTLSPRDELDPWGSTLTLVGENTILLRGTEGQKAICPLGANNTLRLQSSPLGANFTLGIQISPLGARLKMGPCTAESTQSKWPFQKLNHCKLISTLSLSLCHIFGDFVESWISIRLPLSWWAKASQHFYLLTHSRISSPIIVTSLNTQQQQQQHGCSNNNSSNATVLENDANQGCQIFLGTKYQNGKIYQITTNYTKCP
jgi:hypothetical protein